MGKENMNDLIKYCNKIITIEDLTKSVGPGWKKLIIDLCQLCIKHDVTVLDVKEKYGQLRFYVGWAPDELHNAIEAAEKESLTICEACGARGKLRNSHGWLLTLCGKCYNKHEENR